MEYEPVNISVYDTVGNDWLILLMKYFSYHYMSPRNKQSPNDRDIASGYTNQNQKEAINSFFQSSESFDSNRAGFNINKISNFFERIDYVLYHGTTGVQYSIINPVLTQFSNTPLDYSDSQFREFNLNFAYESFTTYNVTNFGLSETDLVRFEDAREFTGPAFESSDWSSNPETYQDELANLGNTPTTESKAHRADQDAPITPIPSTDNSESENYQSTYSEPVTFADQSHKVGDAGLLDILGDVADNALVAAIHGADVRDAALRTAVGGITSVFGAELNDAINQSQDDGGN